MEIKNLEKLTTTNVGILLIVIIPTIMAYLGFFSVSYTSIKQTINEMDKFTLLQITSCVLVLLFSIFYLMIENKINKTNYKLGIYLSESFQKEIDKRNELIIDYADLLRDNANQVLVYSETITRRRIEYIQDKLIVAGLLDRNIPTELLTDMEKDLHNNKSNESYELQVKLYETITNKKYEPNRD